MNTYNEFWRSPDSLRQMVKIQVKSSWFVRNASFIMNQSDVFHKHFVEILTELNW